MKREDYDLAFMLRYENIASYEEGIVKILDRGSTPLPYVSRYVKA